jgi:hypothetical protein
MTIPFLPIPDFLWWAWRRSPSLSWVVGEVSLARKGKVAAPLSGLLMRFSASSRWRLLVRGILEFTSVKPVVGGFLFYFCI